MTPVEGPSETPPDKTRQEQRQDSPSGAEADAEDPQTPADPGPPGRGGRKSARKGPGNRKQEPPKVVEVAPIAPPARLRRRHWGLLFSFMILVIAPVVVSAWYLWFVAEDQYGSVVGFTVRQEEGGTASDMLGGFAASLGGVSTQKDTDILYEYLQSQDLVVRVDDQVDLIGHYSEPWPEDRIFALWPDATIEELTWYWGRMIRISYDATTGLMELRVIAFDAEMAHRISEVLIAESQRLINDLNQQSRTDTMRYAQEDLSEAQARLRSAREALTVFRTRTQIVDPETDVQGRMGVVNTLQQQLAAALIERDLLAERTNLADPRVTQAERRIEVIRQRISDERQNFASGATTADGEDYPTLIAEYEGLVVDREFAEESYRAALTAFDIARANANRQSRYLAAYVRPTLAERSEFPRRYVLVSLVGLFLTLAWSIMALIYYSIRDSR